MIACLKDILQSISNGGCTRCYGQSRNTTLQRSNSLLENALRGVCQTTIYITRIAQTKAIGRVLRIVKDIRRSLINGHSSSIGCGVGLLLSYVKLQGLKM